MRSNRTVFRYDSQKMTKTTKKDIDALFSKVKKPTIKTEIPKTAKRKEAPKGSAADPLGNGQSRNSSSRKFTEEGWPIYSEEELKIGNSAGDTALCPFDCDCCF